MKLHFKKYQGAGNDFVMIDNRQLNWEPEVSDVKFICDRHTGVGADGLILLNNDPEVDFAMRYYNSDGKESTMCGNGGRCITAMARSLEITGEMVRFSAIDGIHEAVIVEEEADIQVVKLKMNDVILKDIKKENTIFINTGSPHQVVFVEDPDKTDVVFQGRFLRNDTNHPGGTNVNFVKMEDNRLTVRTYERGVEDETLSCGTGVTASAVAAAYIKGKKGEIIYKVGTKGGVLKVYLNGTPEKYTDIWLEGPATFVFEGIITI